MLESSFAPGIRNDIEVSDLGYYLKPSIQILYLQPTPTVVFEYLQTMILKFKKLIKIQH